MKKLCKLSFLAIILFTSFSFTTPKEEKSREMLLMQLLQYITSHDYYNKIELNDDFSRKIFKNYLKALDEQKRYFTQADIKEFEKYETLLDDHFKTPDLTFFELSYQRLQQRIAEAENIYKSVVKNNFKFTSKETINLDYDKLPYAKNKKDLRKRWQKIVKYSVLSSFVIKQSEQKEKFEKNNQQDSLKTDKQLLVESVESAKKVFQDNFRYLKETTKDEFFTLFLNSYTTSLDPHTNYLAPEASDDFKQSMSGHFEGIGAQLQRTESGVKVTSIISGGPVWKEKSLEVGDLILKVSADGKKYVDVVGMRLDEVIKHIKGPKGTMVTLTVKKTDGAIKDVSIKRDVVEIEETFAKSTLVKSHGKTFAILDLPSFYVDMDNPESRNSFIDVRNEITKLIKDDAQGLILDLRNNGGGSLKSVTGIVGLFIKSGPVVQVKNNRGFVGQGYDNDEQLLWDKPLIVLVSELSASASEIFSAAMQDYKRGIIIGSNQTFGKGTVQNILSLDQLLGYQGDQPTQELGGLKLTIQKYYRINGGSTQLKGVNSDIEIPGKLKYLNVGEREFPQAMPWDRIEPVKYEVWKDNTNWEQAIAQSKKRISEAPLFKLMEEYALFTKSQQDKKEYSLNYKIFKKEKEQEEVNIKKFEELTKHKSDLKFETLSSEKQRMEQKEDVKERFNRWHETLQKDLYIEEAVRVLHDLVP